MSYTGSEILLQSLVEENVEVIFGYPGGAVIPLFDKLAKEDRLRLILPRHEQAAAHAADAYARVSGKVWLISQYIESDGGVPDPPTQLRGGFRPLEGCTFDSFAARGESASRYANQHGVGAAFIEQGSCHHCQDFWVSCFVVATTSLGFR